MKLFMTAMILVLAATAARAAESLCPSNPDALGTARILAVDAATTPPVGRQHFPQTLALRRNEVVLTFDDGPWPGSTARVLDALAHESVKATFFLIGRNAVANPAPGARREPAEGHTVASHTYSHPLLDRMPFGAAESEIERGMAAVDTVLYGHAGHAPVTPFFRFPGFASSPALLDQMARRGIAVFDADLWASDWNKMSAEQELRLVLARIEAANGGIVLLHDTKAQTGGHAAGLSACALKSRGYAHCPRRAGIAARRHIQILTVPVCAACAGGHSSARHAACSFAMSVES